MNMCIRFEGEQGTVGKLMLGYFVVPKMPL